VKGRKGERGEREKGRKRRVGEKVKGRVGEW
jgi:hypothetical protein